MDQQAITIILGIVLIVVLVASYVRYRRGDDGQDPSASVSVSETMREAKEYFGIRSGKDNDGGLSKTLDLEAVELLSGIGSTARARRAGSPGKKSGERGSKRA